MIVSVPKETVPGEQRVALVPELVPKLTKASLEVIVQSGAGESAKRLRLLRPGSKKSRSLRTRGTFMVEICTGGKVILHFALAGSGDPVQTNGLRIQARQRYASKAAVLCIQSQQEL